MLHAAKSGERAQTELAQMAGLDKTTMVVTLDEMEAQGLASGVYPLVRASACDARLRDRRRPRRPRVAVTVLPKGGAAEQPEPVAEPDFGTKRPRSRSRLGDHQAPGGTSRRAPLSPWQTSPG